MKSYIKRLNPIELQAWKEAVELEDQKKDEYRRALRIKDRLKRELIQKYVPEASYLDFYRIDEKDGTLYEEEFFK